MPFMFIIFTESTAKEMYSMLNMSRQGCIELNGFQVCFLLAGTGSTVGNQTKRPFPLHTGVDTCMLIDHEGRILV